MFSELFPVCDIIIPYPKVNVNSFQEKYRIVFVHIFYLFCLLTNLHIYDIIDMLVFCTLLSADGRE